MNKFKKTIPFFILAVVIIGSAFYLFNFKTSLAPSEGTKSTPEIVIPKEIAAPDLDREIVVPEYFPPEAVEIATEKLNSFISDLKENPDNFNVWIELGIYRKMINDYEGARDVWEYVSFIRPKNSTSFNNLGDLYGYYLKEPQKAELNYIKAIENAPDQVILYYNFHKFYIDILNDPSKAKDILERGIEANPDSSETLKQALGLLE